MLEKKGIKKIGFSSQKGSTDRGYGQPVNRLRNQSTGCGRPVEDRSREIKNLISLPIASSSRSRSGRGLVEATVTCHVLNALTASEPIDP